MGTTLTKFVSITRVKKFDCPEFACFIRTGGIRNIELNVCHVFRGSRQGKPLL
jgi:hypothetical protein